MLFQSRSTLNQTAYPYFVAVVSSKSAMYILESKAQDGPVSDHY